MITARNYAAQAEASLRKWSGQARRAGYRWCEIDARNCEELADCIRRAIHFALPDGGSIFDDGLKGLNGLDVHLPYGLMTFEYFEPERFLLEDQVYSPKRLVVAHELDCAAGKLAYGDELARHGWASQWNPFTAIPEHCATVIHVAVVNEIHGHWLPQGMAALIPCVWDCAQEVGIVKILINKDDIEGQAISVVPIPFLPGALDLRIKADDEAIKSAISDIAGETRALLELCEALACSNVTTEILQPKNARINAKRARKGKLPLYETRTLTIEVPHLNRRGQYEIGDRRGPRQHLRRGHIRRLDDTRRIWINSCVVGSAENGRIDKDYRITD